MMVNYLKLFDKDNRKVIYAISSLLLVDVIMIFIMKLASFPVFYPFIIILELMIHLICIHSIYNTSKNNKLLYIIATFTTYMIISILLSFIINIIITKESLLLTMSGYLGLNIFHYIKNIMYIIFNYSNTVPLVVLNNIVFIVAIVIRVIYMLYYLIKK